MTPPVRPRGGRRVFEVHFCVMRGTRPMLLSVDRRLSEVREEELCSVISRQLELLKADTLFVQFYSILLP